MFDYIDRTMTSQRRKYLYRVTGAGLGVAAVYGLVDGQEAAALLLFAMAALGLADRNVTPHIDEDMPTGDQS